jgi:hypothetical protein
MLGLPAMDQMLKDSPAQSSKETSDLEPLGIFGALRASAIKALPEAISVLVMGTIAVSLVGGIWAHMAPSLPPGVDGKTLSAAQRSISSLIRWPSIKEHQFLIVYFIFFLHNLRLHLFANPGVARDEQLESYDPNARPRLYRGWFGLIVGNAFGAMCSAFALFWVQQFSLSQFLWHAFLLPVFSLLQNAGSSLFGPSFGGTMQNWIAWYGENQFKFNFWFLYLAAVCDDLGIPNLKTVGRWCWHRIAARITS